MRIIATILCIYFAGLIVQPLFAVPPVQGKVMSCCAKHMNGKPSKCPMPKKGNKGCCDNNNCNPLCSQCPMCGFSAITQAHITLPVVFQETYQQKHILRNWSFTSSYYPSLLRPPQLV